ncbi:MAG: hypothetical protein U9P70_00980, partial [Patescibacteria group bacterium]|nr:hypothetical protein [Patescibacteria group bacterium]
MNKNISEKEKINLAKSVFARFEEKINALLKRQNEVFKRIMEKINKRKLEEARKKLDNLCKDED